MYIYKITNKINKKCYIGQTTRSVEVRWFEHVKYHMTQRSHCRKLTNALKKYGLENFTVETIDTAISINELNDKEVYWVIHYNSIENGYNLVAGGDNRLISNETRQKISKAGMGRRQSLETIEKISSAQRGSKNHNFGKKASRETREKMSKTRKGVKKTDNHKKKIGIGNSVSIICKENNIIYSSIKEASNSLNLNRNCIYKVLIGIKNNIKGFTFSYIKTK